MKYYGSNLCKRSADRDTLDIKAQPAADTCGRVAMFVTCYGNRNNPGVVEDLLAVLEHNRIPVSPVGQERCCGMLKLELGDL
ncbi:Fe-S oxidoreductase [Methylohalomonas lacus]|uniref:Fe-S oxidoreductase n=1 Tax=Methylohalomonas lacus TaxID=398773 RepID=A0AAE3HI24_9GAMM|nr:heterodisulfide reductase-related iron-sulfur binding cluster [Methylohalomonas lacus]MCS3902730.1 Fe-S oxidoreductase [Methylohalomonas lacus]